MDDGMRVWLDGNLIIDSWTPSQEHTMTTDQFLNAGDHDLRVEYFEDRGQAVARFSLSLVGSNSGGAFYPNWKAEYFNNTTLSRPPALVRDDRYLSHNWGTGSPAPGIITDDLFSARWTKTLTGNPARYQITLTSDDGSRLFINDVLILVIRKDNTKSRNLPSICYNKQIYNFINNVFKWYLNRPFRWSTVLINWSKH